MLPSCSGEMYHCCKLAAWLNCKWQCNTCGSGIKLQRSVVCNWFLVLYPLKQTMIFLHFTTMQDNKSSLASRVFLIDSRFIPDKSRDTVLLFYIPFDPFDSATPLPFVPTVMDRKSFLQEFLLDINFVHLWIYASFCFSLSTTESDGYQKMLQLWLYILNEKKCCNDDITSRVHKNVAIMILYLECKRILQLWLQLECKMMSQLWHYIQNVKECCNNDT